MVTVPDDHGFIVSGLGKRGPKSLATHAVHRYGCPQPRRDVPERDRAQTGGGLAVKPDDHAGRSGKSQADTLA